MLRAFDEDQEILSRNNRMETQKKTSGIETSVIETSVIEGISVPKDSELSALPTKDSEKLNKGNGISVAKDSELSALPTKDSKKLNKGNEGVSVLEMAAKDSEKLNKNKGKRVNAGNKGIVEKMKREITKLNETIDRMTTDYDKLDAKNQNLEKMIDTMAKETDEWRNKYIELLKNGNNERQVIFEGYTRLYDQLSRFSGAGPSFP